MSGLRVQIRKELEERFREVAMKRFGYMKGALSKAAEEAIENWLNSIEDLKFEEDPVKAIKGLLSEVKMNSVELQHLAKKIWTK